MSNRHEPGSRSLWPLLMLTATLGAAPALAAGPSSAAASQAQYQRDAAVCLSRGYKGASP